LAGRRSFRNRDSTRKDSGFAGASGLETGDCGAIDFVELPDSIMMIVQP
jgi:hypothetical protein